MNQIARCDWLPERARWSHLARSGLPVVSRKKNFSQSHIINPLLTKFVRSRWLDIGFVSVHKLAKKELGQYPAILTSHLVNNPYILHKFRRDNAHYKYLTIILRNRAEYRLILSRRGRRPSRLKSDDIPRD